MKAYIFIFISILKLVLAQENNFLQVEKSTVNKSKCYNPTTNENVDWYFIFMMKEVYGDYFYMDNTMKDTMKLKITDANFSPLQMAFSLNSQKSNYIAWNDDSMIEGKEGFSAQAHAKGIISYDTEDGTILIHSLPKFPMVTKAGKFSSTFPNNQGTYVQTFICVTVSLKDLVPILEQLKDLKLGIQASNSDNKIVKKVDDMLNLVLQSKRRTKKPEDAIEILSFKSVGGQNFDLFSKVNNVMELPWDRNIPNFYKEDLYVGTWTRPSQLPNVCEKYKTINIASFNINGTKYTNNEDHSKWGYSKSVLCIGDLNRSESQLKRSGSVLCMKNTKVSGIVSKFSDTVEACDSKTQLSYLEEMSNSVQ